jgi:DNA sulfur modification protein DndD
MYIKQIRLKNYRCYKKAEIKFGLESKSGRNINLATGEIAAGKTTLFNAVGWCLYGSETQLILGTKTEEKDEKAIPNEDSYEGDKAVVEVDVDLKIPESKYIESLSIRRVCTFIKGSAQPSSTVFSIDAYHAGEKQKISDYRKFLNHFLPKDLIQFYLFDGEYLQHTATNSNLKIKDGLRKLFNIEKIENASEIIGQLISEYYKQSSKMPKQNIQVKDKETQIVDWLEKKRIADANIVEEEKKIAKYSLDINELTEEVKKSSQLQGAVKKFEELEKKENEIENSLKQENDNYYTHILTNAYLINGKTILQQVNAIVEKETKVKILPANVRQKFLNLLIDRHSCVCGTPIKKGSKEEKCINSELKVAESEELLDFLSDLTYQISYVLKTTDEMATTIKKEAGEINRLESERKKITTLKNEVQKELPKGDIDLETLKEKFNKCMALTEDRNDSKRFLTTYRSNVAECDYEIGKLRIERDNILDKSGQTNILNTNIKIGEYLQKIFDRFNKKILSNVALELESEINALIAKTNKLAGLNVKITTDNNNIEFKFVEKGSTKHYLTGGQNQLFGIIIMAAFVRIMGRRGEEKLPFVFMDNPFSSIDKGSLDIVSNNLSDLFKNAQVILFTTNDRFERVYKASKENIFTSWILNNDGTNVKFDIQGE